MKTRIATLLADLHNKVMEIQEELEDIERDSDGSEDWHADLLEAQDALDTMEAESSELDCSWNNYEDGDTWDDIEIEQEQRDELAEVFEDYELALELLEDM